MYVSPLHRFCCCLLTQQMNTKYFIFLQWLFFIHLTSIDCLLRLVLINIPVKVIRLRVRQRNTTRINSDMCVSRKPKIILQTKNKKQTTNNDNIIKQNLINNYGHKTDLLYQSIHILINSFSLHTNKIHVNYSIFTFN